MERRSSWQIAVALLFLTSLICAQAPAMPGAPVALPARDLGPILDQLSAIPGTPVKFDRTRVEQGYVQDVYTLVVNLRSLAVLLGLRQEGRPEDRAKINELADRMDTHFRALLIQRELRNPARVPDRDNLTRYAEKDRMLAPPAPGEQRVVFMGDSITDGWPIQEYFIGKPYVNRGISGQITGEMLGRMKADVLDLKPVAMIVLAGTNDLARGVAVPVVENNLTMIGLLAKSQGIKVIFTSITPINGVNIQTRPADKILEINKFLRELCEKEGYVYVDYHAALKNDQGLIPKELAADGLHPNAEGYKLMAPLAQAGIDKALAGSAPKPHKK